MTDDRPIRLPLDGSLSLDAMQRAIINEVLRKPGRTSVWRPGRSAPRARSYAIAHRSAV